MTGARKWCKTAKTIALKNLGQFPFVRTDWPDQTVTMRTVSLLIKTIQPDQSNLKWYAQRRWVFVKLLEKDYFIVKMTSPAIIQPTSSDFWKVPLASMIIHNCAVTEQKQITLWLIQAQSWIRFVFWTSQSHSWTTMSIWFTQELG